MHVLPVELLPVQETLVLRARGSELLILPSHIRELKNLSKAKDFSQYFRAEALLNRPARKLFEAWLRKDQTLWTRLYRVVHKEMELGAEEPEEAPAPKEEAPKAKKPAAKAKKAAPKEEEKEEKAAKKTTKKKTAAKKTATKKTAAKKTATKKTAAKKTATKKTATKKTAAKKTAKKKA